jgi:Tol biopolymer transport system component
MLGRGYRAVNGSWLAGGCLPQEWLCSTMGATSDGCDNTGREGMRVAWLVSAAAVALLALAACDSDGGDDAVADGTQSAVPATGRIVFTSERDDNGEVYVMNADGSDQTNITNDPASDGEPSWSPDGTRIAFSSQRGGPAQNIYTMSADGGDVLQLTDTLAVDGGVQWSPDGSRIVFYGFEQASIGFLWLTGAEGGDAIPLLESIHPASPEVTCAGGFPGGWFPDNQRIVFRGSHAGSGAGQICSVNADGTDIQVIFSEPDTFSFSPAVSPDGKKIAFVSNRDGNYEIYVMDADGTNLQRVTTDEGSDEYPAWSPDGQWIAFASDRDGDFEIFIIRPDGTGLGQLTDNTARDIDPSWGPAP